MECAKCGKDIQNGRPRIFSDPEKLRQLRDFFLKEGMGYRKIAEALHCSPTTCQKAINYFGLREEKAALFADKPQLPKRFLKDEDLQRLVELYENGWSIVKLSKEFECSEYACKQALLAINHPIRNQKEAAIFVVRRKFPKCFRKKKTSQKTDCHIKTRKKDEVQTTKSEEENDVAKVKTKRKRIDNINVFMETLTEVEKSEIISSYLEGQDIDKLAKKYGTIPAVITVFLKLKNGIELREKAPHERVYHYNHLTEKEKDILFVLLCEGLSDEEIMQRMAVTPNQLKNYRRTFNNTRSN